MNTAKALVVCLLSLCTLAAALDEINAASQLKQFAEALDEQALSVNEKRAELQWFLSQTEAGRDFVKDVYNDSKQDVQLRKAALYIFCKCWSEGREGRLKNAEKSGNKDLRAFALRLRAYLAGVAPAPQAEEPLPREELLEKLSRALGSADDKRVATALASASQQAKLVFAFSDWPELVAQVAAKAPPELKATLLKHLVTHAPLINAETRARISKTVGEDVFDAAGDQVTVWVQNKESGRKQALSSLAKLAEEKNRDGLLLLLNALVRRGTPQLLSAVAELLNYDDRDVAQAALAVFAQHAKELGANLASPKQCYIWWVGRRLSTGE